MDNEKIFTFDFDTTKTKAIRSALDERPVFTTKIKKEIAVKKEGSWKSIKSTFSAFDTIYVSLCRIEDTLCYINTLELGNNKEGRRSAFDFFDFLNNVYVVVHCIRTLAIVFSLDDKVKEIEKSTECFRQKGLDGKGSDHDFFEYVRSLVSVHPTDTSMHPSYNGYEKMHCSPFVVWAIDGLGREGDLSVHIYNSEEDGDIEVLQLYVGDFKRYLEKWISFMDVIIEGKKSFQDKSVEQLVDRVIPMPEMFDSYAQYIANLKKEYKDRDGGYSDYVLEYYEKLFSIELTDPRNVEKFNLYKNAIKYSLDFLQKRLQTMSNDDNSFTGINLPESHLYTELYLELWISTNHEGPLGNHNYEIEKLSYLDDSGSFDERYARNLLEKIKPLINEYVVFDNTESAFETKVLISMALYFEALCHCGILNRNIPNSLEYRDRLLSACEQQVLLDDLKKRMNPKKENKFLRFVFKN